MDDVPRYSQDESEDHRQVGWMAGNRPPWRATLCALSCALLAGPVAAETSLRVESSYYRKLHEKLDPGSIVVFLKNRSGETPLKIAAVKLDDIALPVSNVGPPVPQTTDKKAGMPPPKDEAPVDEKEEDIPHNDAPAKDALPPVLDIKPEDYSGRRIIWAYLWPNPIPPNGLAELRIQMANRLTRTCKVTFDCGEGGTLEAKVGPWAPPVRMASVGFPTSLDSIYLYVESQSERDELIEGLTLNGKTVPPKDLWIPERKLKPGTTALAKIKTPAELAWGDRVYLGLKPGRGQLVMESARVMTGVVLGMEGGRGVWDLKPNEGLAEPTLRRLPRPSDLTAAGPMPIFEIFACPMHQFQGHRRKCGRHILDRSLEILAQAPKALNCVHLCRVRLDEAAFLFGQVADVMKINPYFWPEKFHDSPREHSSQRYVRLVGLGASPRPVVTCMMAGSVDGKRPTTPEEVWLMFCYLLSRGSKGFLYRGRPNRIEGEFGREILRTCTEINDTVRSLRAFIEICHPWYRGESADGKAEVNGLLAGDKGMVIVLLNRQLKIPGDKPGPFKHDAVKPFACRARVPSWARIKSLVVIEKGQRGRTIPFSLKEGSVSLQIGALDTGRILLAEFEKQEE